MHKVLTFIELSFSINGLFDVLSSCFSTFREEYYMVHLVVGVVSLAVYVYVARKYKN